MFKSIKVRASQGTQYIPDPRSANPVGFRGKPVMGEAACESGCQACVTACPTQAIVLAPGSEQPVHIALNFRTRDLPVRVGKV